MKTNKLKLLELFILRISAYFIYLSMREKPSVEGVLY